MQMIDGCRINCVINSGERLWETWRAGCTEPSCLRRKCSDMFVYKVECCVMKETFCPRIVSTARVSVSSAGAAAGRGVSAGRWALCPGGLPADRSPLGAAASTGPVIWPSALINAGVRCCPALKVEGYDDVCGVRRTGTWAPSRAAQANVPVPGLTLQRSRVQLLFCSVHQTQSWHGDTRTHGAGHTERGIRLSALNQQGVGGGAEATVRVS